MRLELQSTKPRHYNCPTEFKSRLYNSYYFLLSSALLSSEELKELAFFKSTNWDDVLQRKVSTK